MSEYDKDKDIYFNQISIKSIKTKNNNYYLSRNKSNWKERQINPYSLSKDAKPNWIKRIFKKEIIFLTVAEYRLITKLRTRHYNKLNGQNKLIINDWEKICEKCLDFEDQTIDHVLFNCSHCNDLREELLKLLEDYDLNPEIDNILYPFDSELLEATSKTCFMELITKRIEILKLCHKFMNNYTL